MLAFFSVLTTVLMVLATWALLGWLGRIKSRRSNRHRSLRSGRGTRHRRCVHALLNAAPARMLPLGP